MMLAGVAWADLVVEANLALTVLLLVGVVLLWREVFPAAVREVKPRHRRDDNGDA